MRRSAIAFVPLLFVLVFAALTVWETVDRSTIPHGLHGTVTDIDRRAEDNPGQDDAWFVSVNGSAFRMDQAVATRLTRGDVITKNAWSRTMYVDGDPIRIDLSDDARGALWFAPVLVMIGAAQTWLIRRPERAPGRLTSAG